MIRTDRQDLCHVSQLTTFDTTRTYSCAKCHGVLKRGSSHEIQHAFSTRCSVTFAPDQEPDNPYQAADAQCRDTFLAWNPDDLPPVLVLHAVAGAGKSTLMLEYCKRNPECRFLVVTFSKQLQVNLLTVTRTLPNTTVRTYDALCYNETGQSGSFSDRDVCKLAFPRCVSWFTKKGIHQSSQLLEKLLSGYTLRRACPYHQQVNLESYVYPKFLKNAHSLKSFGLGRALATLQGLKSQFDVVFVDEVQDMTQSALTKILDLGLKTICIGDPHQQIYGFDANGCACSFDSNSLPSSFWTQGQAMHLYGTWRLDRTLAYFVQNLFPEIHLFSHAKLYCGRVQYTSKLPETCVLLCRSNAEVLQHVLANPACRSVGLKTVVDQTLAMERHARQRTTALGQLLKAHRGPALTDALARDVETVLATGQCVMTVHRAKGLEFPDVAVKEAMITSLSEQGEERHIVYVALTRPTRCLHVLL